MARKSQDPAASPAPPAEGSTSAKRLPPHELLPIANLMKVSGKAVELHKLNQIAQLLWLPEGSTKEDKNAAIVAAIDLFESLKPADGAESMLAAQMVGTHHAALECLRRAMLSGQTFEGREASLSQAQRLMNLYTQQMVALNKHRGKGQQKITVERVQVAPGAQAVIGDVHGAPAQNVTPALEPPGEGDVPVPPVLTKAKVKR